MAKIFLHGRLRKEFGTSFTLDVANAAEAVRALEANFPGRFFKAIREGTFRVIRGKRKGRYSYDLGEDELLLGLGKSELHLVPVAAGSGSSRGGIKVVVGVAIMAVAVVASGGAASLAAGEGMAGLTAAMAAPAAMGVSWGSIAMFGVSMTLSGISTMLSPQLKAGSLESVDKRPSFLFNGPVNTMEQGGAIPLIYGRVRVGSTVVSAGQFAETSSSVAPTSVADGDTISVDGLPSDGLTLNQSYSFTVARPLNHPAATHMLAKDIAGTLTLNDAPTYHPISDGQFVSLDDAITYGLRFTPDDKALSLVDVGGSIFATQGYVVAGDGFTPVGEVRSVSAMVHSPAGSDDESGSGELNGGRIRGSGGGSSKGGGSSGGAKEDANTLTSKSVVRVLELIGEGEIGGLVNGDKSVYFDNTPLVAEDGTANFTGVTWEQRVGLPDQDYIPGFSSAEAEVSVGTEIKASASATRTITDPNTDALRVTIRLPALTQADTSTGDLHGSSVQVAVDLRSAGKGWMQVAGDTIEGKTTSPYERSYRFDLPVGGAPWDVRVRRITADSTSTAIQNQTYWQSYTAIVNGKFKHPNTALIGITVAAEQLGTRVPARSYDVNGLTIRVPANFDPVANTYNGIWNGSFKLAWSNNPAWILYDILTNPRYGLGDSIAESGVDKWGLYTTGQYCSELVPDGHGGFEPRYAFNGVLQSREDAYKVVQAICSTFRGMAYWSSGQVFAKSDMPSDPVKLVAPANVIGGSFNYSGTALKARHSVALVSWNDPLDGYRQAIEVVENPELIQTFGWRQTEIAAFGCTSRAQARRMGKLLLDVEQHETETVTYEASYDHADVMPGDIILLQDPNYASVRFSGRVIAFESSLSQNKITLDAPVVLEANKTYTITVSLADGTLHERSIGVYPGSHMRFSFLRHCPPPRNLGAFGL